MTSINVIPVTGGSVAEADRRQRMPEAAMITAEQLGERYLAVHHRMFRAVNDEMSGCGLSIARTKVLRIWRAVD